MSQGSTGPVAQFVSPAHMLPPARQRIANRAAMGYSNDQIAGQLGLSLSTVKNQLSLAYQQLGICTRQELLLLALYRGWIQLAEALAATGLQPDQPAGRRP